MKGGQIRGSSPARRGLRGLHEGRPLSGDAIEVGTHRSVQGRELGRQVVQEGSPHGGIGTHEREVLGGENNGAHEPEDVAGPDLRPVDARAIGLAAHDFQLDDLFASRGDDPCADDGSARGILGLVRGDTNESALRTDPVRREGRQVGQRLNEVRFTLAVRAHQDRGSGGQLDDSVFPGTEVVEGQVRDAHVRCRSGWASAGSETG